MASLSFILCAFLLLQGAWGGPAKPKDSDEKSNTETDADKTKEVTTTESLGTQLSNNMNENLLKVMDNLRTGAVQISTPMVKLGVDIMPNIFTSSFKTVTESASKIADANKKGFRKLIHGASNALGAGAVFGSAVIGANMKIAGSSLGIANSLIETSAKFGLDITGNLADTTALSNMLFANITKDILAGVGGGLNAVGDGVTVLSKGSAKVIDAIGHSISKSISNAQDTMAKWFKSGSAKLQDGAMTLTNTAQVEYYNALQWYLHNLLAMEGVMDKLTETINPSVTEAEDSGKKLDEEVDSSATNGDKTDAADDKTKAGTTDDNTEAGADVDETKAGAADEKTKAGTTDPNTEAGAADEKTEVVADNVKTEPVADDDNTKAVADAADKPTPDNKTDAEATLADSAEKTAAVAEKTAAVAATTNA